jgi:hypothetical protein
MIFDFLVPWSDDAQDGVAEQCQIAFDLFGLVAQDKPAGGGLGARN